MLGRGEYLKPKTQSYCDFGQQVDGLHEVVGGFAREADDDVGRNRDVAAGGLDPADALEVPVAGVLAGHHLEDAGGAGLDGQVDVVAEGRRGVDGVDDVAGEVARVAGGEADAADAGDLADGGEQFGEGPLPFRIAVAVDVLAEELDLGVAEVGDAAGFFEDGGGGAAALLAAGVGDDAVGAEFVAAFDDGDVAAVGVLAGGELGLEGLVGLAVVEAGDAVLAGFEAGRASRAGCGRRRSRRRGRRRGRGRRSSRPPAGRRSRGRRSACRLCGASCTR